MDANRLADLVTSLVSLYIRSVSPKTSLFVTSKLLRLYYLSIHYTKRNRAKKIDSYPLHHAQV